MGGGGGGQGLAALSGDGCDMGANDGNSFLD